MDALLMPVSIEKESLNIKAVTGLIRTITSFEIKPKDDQTKQIDCITKLQKFITADENGDFVIDRIYNKSTGCIQALLRTISVCCYPHVVLRSFTLIHKSVSQKRSLKGSLAREASTSILFDEGQVLINVLMNIEDQLEFAGCASKIINSTYFYLLSILDIACKRDKKFCRYFDRYQVLKQLLYLLGKYNKTFKISVVLIDIFRWIMKTRNANEFMPNKTFFENLDSIFTMLKCRKSPKIKNMVILIKLLTRNDDIHESIFETRVIFNLLQILVNDDNFPVTYSTYKAIILSISKIIKKENFLQHFQTNANIRLLHRFCAHFTTSEDKQYSILLKVCSVIHACLSKRELFIEGYKCYSFPLPITRRSDVKEEDYMSAAYSDDSDDDAEEEDELEEDEDEDDEDNDQQFILNTEDDDNIKTKQTKEKRKSFNFQESIPKKPLLPSTANLYLTKELLLEQNFQEKLSEEIDSKIKIFEKIDPNSKNIYNILASRVCTNRQIVKVAYPDMIGAQSLSQTQYMITNCSKFPRAKLLEILDRAINEKSQTIYPLIYDLDQLQRFDNQRCDILKCDDLNTLASSSNSSSLKFESRFEAGNLRKVYRVSQHIYNLVLAPDVNTNRKYQWFYFEVSNTKAQVSYVFNIINCDKSNTQYNNGMQPVMFSVKDATLGKIGWVRNGSDIFYYRNNYYDPVQPFAVYNTLSFTVRFPHSNDVCYFAYHYPYTYTKLMTYLYGLQANSPSNIYLSVDTLSSTLANNPVPLLTITAPRSSHNPMKRRKVIVLTSRVHPAESNSSWAMEGTIRYLLQDDTASRQLRDEYVFKIVPMQNPEGVIYGSCRCGLTTEDLNRCWQNPDSVRHPEVFHVKAMIQRVIQDYKRPVSLYLDYHGHSRKKNFFLYGCSNKASWKKSDRRLADNIEEYMHYPTVLGDITKSLNLKSCKFSVEKNRESTARITIWREFGVKCSYTVECSYCGFDVGPHKTQAINTKHLFEVGSSLMRALWLITSEVKRCKLTLPYLCISYKETASSNTNPNIRDENSDVTNNN